MSTDPVAPKLTRADFQSDQDVRWCPGCGDYAILAQVQKVFPTLGIPKEDFVVISGIGCSSRFPYYMNTYGMHSIHGRAPAVATGLKSFNPDLSVWVITGDGDSLSIGGNHLLHVIRRNVDLKILLFNNEIYGLTKGQYSPTSEKGKRTKSTPMGSIDAPVHPLSVALGANASFVARTIDREPKHLVQILNRAARHKGTALVEIFQNCNIFNDGTFAFLTDRKSKGEGQLIVEDGKPLIFGKEKEKGIIFEGFEAKIVNVEEVGIEKIHVHDEAGPISYHMALARLCRPEMPTALGVIRQVERDAYDQQLNDQIKHATETKGEGTISDLLRGGTTWTVE
jgi:2-oxoglutarate ferredoxin oxidoreductase subunit beta